MTSPTQRTLKHLRDAGYYAAIVEHFNPWVKIRQDAFGILDIIAVHREHPGVLGIQCTSASNMSSRVKKILAAPVTPTWIAAGNRLEVWGWSKKGARGKRKTWCLTVHPILDSAVAQHFNPSVE